MSTSTLGKRQKTFEQNMATVMKIVNFIVSHVFNNRHFKMLPAKGNSQCSGLLIHNIVRWLSHRHTLYHTVGCLPEKKTIYVSQEIKLPLNCKTRDG
jgi:hypothetical protein